MAINKKAPVDFLVKRTKETKEFLLKEKKDEDDVIVGHKMTHGKVYYVCKNPKFIKTV